MSRPGSADFPPRRRLPARTPPREWRFGSRACSRAPGRTPTSWDESATHSARFGHVLQTPDARNLECLYLPAALARKALIVYRCARRHHLQDKDMRYRFARFVPATLVASLAAVAFAAHSDEGKTAAQKARHEHYEHLGDAFKAVRDASKSDSPD